MTENEINEDVEGHKHYPAVEDDVEGHKREFAGATEDDDVEGHSRRPT